MRQVVVDTETTGLSPQDGHRIIEVGCLELVNRRMTGRTFHYYFNPEREIEAGALAVHGITNEFLADKPLFAALAQELLEFLQDAELVIHNAPFDIGFLNYEFKRHNAKFTSMLDYCSVLDTLPLARQKHPGQQNSLDALCRRYEVDNSQRQHHGALLDARLLADVYLAMTGGQTNLFADFESTQQQQNISSDSVSKIRQYQLRVLAANAEELKLHEQYLAALQKKSGGKLVWPEDTTS